MLRYLAVLALTAASFAQTCPPIQVRVAKGNFFTEAQENQLGDVVAEHWQQRLSFIHDDALAAHMRIIAAKLVAQLPTSMQYHFELIDLDRPNAFSLPGGRIYVSRKIIALAQSDDEIAGILAHELGHEVTHQGAAFVSRWLRALGVNSVTSPDDIRQRYNQMLDSQASRMVKVDNPEDDQLDADSVAIQAMTRAGYDPHAFATQFSRLTAAKGKGNFFADLFGSSDPDSNRLKTIQKVVATIPPQCRTGKPQLAETFEAWQASVIGFTSAASSGTAALPGLLYQRNLSPTLRPDVNTIRYSRDGKYLIVQDSGQIEIVTRQPFTSYLRIPAANAEPAQFSADSQTVSFYIGESAPRVEIWSLAGKNRLAVHELNTHHTCLQSELSPDGKYFACVHSSQEALGVQFDLLVYDTASGAEIVRKNNLRDAMGYGALMFEVVILVDRYVSRNVPWIHLDFSPDGRYLVAAQGNRVVAYDLQQRTPVTLASPIKASVGNGFAFLSSDRILTRKEKGDSELRSFPDGQLVKAGIATGNANLYRAGSPDYVLLAPIHNLAIGLLDLNQNKIVAGWNTPALDGWGGELSVELKDGLLVSSLIGNTKPSAVLKLSDSTLGNVHIAAASGDLSWLALSDHTRGAVWSLATGQRAYHVTGFDGAYLDRNIFYGDIPKRAKSERTLAQLNLSNPSAQEVTGVDLKTGDFSTVIQKGAVLLDIKRDAKHRENADAYCRSGFFGRNWTAQVMSQLDVEDTATQKLLWTKSFPKYIEDYFAHPAADSIAFMQCNKDMVQIEFLQLSSGKNLGSLSLNSNKNSFSVTDAQAAGDVFIVSDNEMRIGLYGRDGHSIARLFGAGPVAAPVSHLLAVLSEKQELTLYELASGQKRNALSFSQPVLFYRFDESGRKLLVVTADQLAYVFDTEAIKTEQSAKGN